MVTEEMRIVLDISKVKDSSVTFTVNTRPVLDVYTLDLAKQQKQTVLKDLRNVNRILQQVREKEKKAIFNKIAEKGSPCVIAN